MLFVSYSHRDARIVRPVVRFLRATGSDVFVDAESLDYGDDWRAQLDNAISKATRFLLFWSRDASVSSEIEHEWRTALNCDGLSIVPVLLDDTPLPSPLSGYHGTDDLRALAATMRRREQAFRYAIVLAVLLFGVGTVSLSDFNDGQKPTPTAEATQQSPPFVTRGERVPIAPAATDPQPDGGASLAVLAALLLLALGGLLEWRQRPRRRLASALVSAASTNPETG